ncbi:hypothetical protein IFM89_025650 [Coptis chinensis]|uniref:Chromatin-remodeling ATPase INO80 n=1 Tax=Coptis chinensis TaxID=261450 RepID=A0A835LJF1_9MAGN|nr:hypothetical protein IFM89_025650 [Coptis chinensis]
MERNYTQPNSYEFESLINFQQGDGGGYDNYGNGRGAMMVEHSNGILTKKNKKVIISNVEADADSNDEEDYGNNHISEERYRSMLGEHIHKYRRVRYKESSSRPAPSPMGMSVPRRNGNGGSKGRKLGSEERLLHGMEISPGYIGDQVSYYEAGFQPEYGVDTLYSSIESALLDIGEGIKYRVPPAYDKLAATLKLPSFKDIQVDEYYLKGTLDMGSMAMMMASYSRFGSRNRSGMGEPQSQYESLQARLNALSACNSVQKFNLQVCDIGLDSSSIPEGAAGGIRRSIMSEGGMLQIYYVKVLEKGDTYEIIERSLPKKQIVKKDLATIEKEEMEKIGKVWINIARRDIPRHQKIFTNIHRKQLADAKRFSETCQREVKLKVSRSIKLMRGAAIRTRKLARDMLVLWKRIDREEAEMRKQKEKEAAEALKREEELREAKRQQQRLNFLLSQTELYSHFMQNKSTSQPSESLPVGDGESNDLDTVEEVVAGEEEDAEDAELKREALIAAQSAVSQQKMITSAFDNECLKLRQAAEPDEPSKDATIAGSSNIDLLNPSTMPIVSSVQTPEMFKGCLKEYQLKGLQWLVNCYEQGLNGILADEMGLGKTIQAMAFLAHLSEEKNIWGPFLIVAPASVLNNWADEISRFCPDLKTLPYWGGLQERVILRKNINPKRLYRREAGFHILITSYQLLVADEKYFRRVKWQYMVLDEAQAIKSSNSIRWKTLLSFNCRNRLLLTGTPIQNNMAEVVGLLHFIMPTLFDSHEQFNEWFSKGIEGHAEHGGTLNEHQLNRLHAVLKPFMLRRVKKDVITEMTGKIEITVHCKLSSRQQAFYRAIKNKISLAELFDGRRGHLNEKKILNLMNIVIQLRKVCNHPELFERNEGSTYLYFGEIPNSLLPAAFGELEEIYYAGSRNPITYEVPKLVHQGFGPSAGTLCSACEKLFNVFSPGNIYQSSVQLDKRSDECTTANRGSFGFSRLMDLSAEEVAFLARGSFMDRLLFSVMRWDRQFLDEILDFVIEDEGDDFHYEHLDRGKFLRKFTFPGQINAHCSNRSFAYRQIEELHHPWVKRLFIGFARTSEFNGPKEPSVPPHHLIQEIDSELPVAEPILQLTYKIFGSSPPHLKLRSLRKCSRLKITVCSSLPKWLKMLNILEDYMNYRKYRYLRLDGSSTIMDRRDMVRDFQDRNDIFVFLLSTRAGGLGINLTAADTVIFYESDWNPTLDLQAMDRAHRLGQTKEVTVYRLICKETVEEKILQRASQKNTVQQLVMTGGHVQGDLLAPEDVVSLLLDDAQMEQKLRQIPLQAKDRQKKKRGTKGIRIDAEGDASLEDLTDTVPPSSVPDATPDQGASNKKRKPNSDKQNPPQPRSSQKVPGNIDSLNGMNEPDQMDYELEDPQRITDLEQQRPKRPKRPKKSVNENLEPALAATSTSIPQVSGYMISAMPVSGQQHGR